jgi:hypothetical protein
MRRCQTLLAVRERLLAFELSNEMSLPTYPKYHIKKTNK